MVAAPSSFPRKEPSLVSRLGDRVFAFRDRLLRSPVFHRWASSFPLTRPLANRRARALFDLCAGFVYSQVLLSCVELGLFDLLSEGPLDEARLAEHTGLEPKALHTLLNAAVSLKLLERRGQSPDGHSRYGLGALGAVLPGNRGIQGMVEHHRLLYRDLSDPVGLLRAPHRPTDLGRYWAYARQTDEAPREASAVSAYSELMAASQSFIAEDVLDAYDFSRHTHLLDVGGGEGAFAKAVAARHAALEISLFDLPPVAERARSHLAGVGLGDRIVPVGGDFFADGLPQGADLISLIRILHDHDDPKAMALLKAIHKALPPGGRLVLGEPFAQTPGAEPIGHAYFGLYLLAMGSGRPRTPKEVRHMLKRAGFRTSRQLTTRRPILTGVILAEK